MIIEGGHFTLGAQKPAADADLQVRYTVLHFCFLFFFLTYLFIWPWLVLFPACGIFSCSVWDLVPLPGIKPGALALETWSLSPWITREVPVLHIRRCHGFSQWFHQWESRWINHPLSPATHLFPSQIPSCHRKIPWRRKWQPSAVFLLGKFHGQRNLASCSQWGHRVRPNWACMHIIYILHAGCYGSENEYDK